MFRLRFAAVAFAASLGLTAGCSSLSMSFHSLFHRNTDCVADDCSCVNGGGVIGSDGPILGDLGGVPPAPLLPGQGSCQTPGVPNSVPPLSAPPRLIPTPQPATPAPYNPGPSR